jgi:hypothetical protein
MRGFAAVNWMQRHVAARHDKKATLQDVTTAHAVVILIPQSREKDLTQARASHNFLSVTVAAIVRSLTPFGMTSAWRAPTAKPADYFPDQLSRRFS